MFFSSKKSADDSRRTFKVVEALNRDGCSTKFNVDARYKSDKTGSPMPAARKAFSQLCRVKNIKGRCAFYLTIQETTQGSDKKQYTYKLIRVKLAEPILIGEGDAQRRIEYKTEAKSMSPEDVARDCKKGKKKSSGRMRKTTAKKMTRKNSKK
jgi:hypothetical protein